MNAAGSTMQSVLSSVISIAKSAIRKIGTEKVQCFIEVSGVADAGRGLSSAVMRRRRFVGFRRRPLQYLLRMGD